MTNLPSLYTVDEAARALRRSPGYLRELLRARKIEGRKLNPRGPWLIPAEAIQAAAVGIGAGIEPAPSLEDTEKSAA